MRRAGFSKLGVLVGSFLVLPACGGGDDDDAGGGTGTVREPWTDFCTATFIEDRQIFDPFDEPVFTARSGEAYLLAEFNTTFADLVYLTNAGPDSFSIDADPNGAYPFTSNCQAGAGVPYYAVFTDVAVYAEEALTTKICDLSAGTALPPAGGSRGFAAAGGFSLDGPATYEVYLDGFSAQCGGNERGYISVPQTQSLGTTTWLVPIMTIIGPD